MSDNTFQNQQLSINNCQKLDTVKENLKKLEFLDILTSF